MNNKGVTLVELLIVIVVLGIISAFAIPAVGGIIENTEKGGVYNDAVMVETAARNYCSVNSCETDQVFTSGTPTGTQLAFSVLDSYLDGFNSSSYTTITATLTSGDWIVQLAAAAGDYEWTDGGTGASDGVGPDEEAPTDLDKGSVTTAS